MLPIVGTDSAPVEVVVSAGEGLAAEWYRDRPARPPRLRYPIAGSARYTASWTNPKRSLFSPPTSKPTAGSPNCCATD